MNRVFSFVAVLAVIGVVAVSLLSTRAAKDLSRPALAAAKPQDAPYLPHDMLHLLDPTIDPCDDFYGHVCGGFERSAKMTGDQLEIAYAWDGVARNNTARLDPLIATSKGKAGIFYRSCLNTTAIEETGVKPLLPFISQIEQVKDLVSLEAVIYWMHKANVVVFYDWSVEVDPRNPRKSALYLMQGGITLPSPSYYTDPSPSMESRRSGYQHVAEHVLSTVCELMHGCDMEKWPAWGAQKSLEVETALAKLFASPAQQRVERAHPFSIDEVAKLSPSLHLPRFINAMAGTFQSKDDTVAGDISIMIRNEDYFRHLSDYIGTQPLDDIKAYLFFRLAFVLGADMNAKMENAGFELQKIVTGQEKKVPRWKKCTHAAMNALPDDVGKLFIDHFFDSQTKEAAQHMVLRLKLAFKADVESARWMVNVTKGQALNKLHKMFFAIGEPAKLDTYKGIHLSETEFLRNGLQLSEWYIHHSFQRLVHDSPRERWGSTSPTMTDAFYSYTDNGLFVPAGILNEPFFSRQYPDARNYGALGGVIGHEITHGFDDQGRKFGQDGQSTNWWTAGDVANFKDRAKCIAEYYSTFSELGKHVDGELTLGEDIADMGGVKISLRALQGLASEKGRGSLSRDEMRLFFTSWGQNWCVVERRRAEELQLLTDEHAPNKFRVNGPLSNLPEFAQAFGCKAGSKMVNAKRCTLW